MKKYDILLIDIDDTIFSLAGAEDIAFVKLLKRIGIDDSNAIREIFYRVTEKYWQDYDDSKITAADCDSGLRFKRFFAELKLSCDAKAAYDYFTEETCRNIFFVANAKEMIEELARDYKIYCISNGLYDLQKERLQTLDVAKYIADIFISDCVGYVKPRIEFFDHVYDSIGRPDKKRILIIGDTLTTDIQGGMDYGIDTCWYNPNHKRKPENLVITYIVNDLSELREIL